jgi:hypothetical protein
VIKQILVICILLSTTTAVSAQNVEGDLPLREALQIIAERYGIRFNYADESIKDVRLTLPPENLSIQEVLQYLEQNTQLGFQQLNNQLVLLVKRNEDSALVCGYIMDNENNKKINGASIQSSKKGTSSNADGYFELANVSRSDTLTIRFLGYQTILIPIKSLAADTCSTVFLKPKVTKLQEVIVSNYIIPGIDVNSDGSIRIKAKTLSMLPGLTDPDVLQTIQALPGIQSINETVSDINVRGGTNDQNLVLWDGIKMYKTGHFFGLISAFNPYLTQEVALIKNGTSTAFSDGVSSTIDIQTDNSVDQEFSGGAGINMINADLFFKIPISQKISVQLSSRRSIADLYQTPTYQQYFDRVFRNTDVTSRSDPQADSLIGSDEQFNFYDITAKLLYDISPADKLRISFLHLYNEINYQENALINNSLESKTSGLEQGNLGAGLHYQRWWSEKVQTSARLYFSSYALKAVNFDIKNNQRLIQENEVLDTGLKLDGRIALTNTLDLFAGYQFFEVGISNLEDINNPPFRRLIKKVLRSHAAFVEGNLSSKSGGSNLRLGLRANYFEKFNRFLLEPRFAFSQRVFRDISFEVLGEIKSQTTNQVIDLQNDFLGVEKRRWVLADEENIPIVESKQLSAGFRFQPGKFLFSIDGYVKEVEGITSSSQGFQNQFQYIRSTGSFAVWGIDAMINQQIGALTSWISYSYANNQYEFPAFTPQVFPNNLDIRHSVTLGTSYQAKNFQVSGGLNWRTGKPYTEGLGVSEGEIIYENPNNSRLDNYLRVDISAKYWWQLSPGIRGEIGASVWNVLNQRNLINIHYQIDQENTVKTVRQYALGFTPNIMFRLYF